MVKRTFSFLWFLPLAVSLGGLGCDSGGDDGATDSSGDLEGGSGDGDTHTGDDSGDDHSDTGDSGGTGDSGDGGDSELPELNEAAVLAWLQAGGYTDWTAESAGHPSDGPHGQVRVFFNPVLETSFMDGNESHPANAAAVKELLDPDESVRGWAVSIKADADSADGDNWYWFEYSGDTVVVADFGANLCTGCHGTGGVDYVLTSYPLD